MDDYHHRGSEASLLAALGIGPESALLNEPRLLLNQKFLGALMAELDDELGVEDARLTFFQIGFLHGLRDAERIVQAGFLESGAASAAPAAPSIAIQLGGRSRDAASGAITLGGSWPERFEANARVARLGPEDAPSCTLSAGYTSGWLSGTLEADILAVESTCSASGDACCSFRAAEPEVWRDSQNAEAQLLLRSIPFSALREVVAQSSRPQPQPRPSAGFDPNDPVVHSWGPVMVMPFLSPEEALETIQVLESSPDTCSARVVVIDLRGIDLDEDFGAAALEQVLGAIEGWGADSILTGVSQLSEPVVQGLEVAHCILRKDLSEAIASAFQLADAQRHAL